MPPESLHLDRKDFSKERRQERQESLGSVARWRDSLSHHGQREFNRVGSADSRRHSGDMMLKNECRPSISRCDGKYARSSREPQGPFSQKDWRAHSGETCNGYPDVSARPHKVNNDQRLVTETLIYPSDAYSGFVNTLDQIHSKEQYDVVGFNGSGIGQGYDKENQLGPLDWKTLKWACSGSLSSRGSGFSHSSSSKSMGGVDSNEVKAESRPKNATSLQHPSGDAATCVTSASPSDETGSRKKPRLKWGEGLAKYEKKKLDVPAEDLNGNVAIFSSSNSESAHAQGSNLSVKSPKVIGISDRASPATPSSFACSSSPGLEKSFVKSPNNGDASNLCVLSGPGDQSHLERFPFNLEKLDISPIVNLGPITELLQLDNPNPADSSVARSTAMSSELLVWKSDISKALEITETEIDMLENELKSLKSELDGNCAFPEASSLMPVESNSKPCQEQGGLILRPAPLHVISSEDKTLEETPICNGASGEVHDEDLDSPGTATSKFIEPLSECAGNLIKSKSGSPGLICPVSGPWEDKTGLSTCIDANSFGIKKDEHVSTDPSLHAERENVLLKLILASNKESADWASEVFNKLPPSNQYKFDVLEATNALVCHNAPLIREKLATRKNLLRFKERAITLKFKALRHLWKENLHELSVNKYRAKSQRKIESSLWTAHNGGQKHRSSIHPRFLSPVRNSSMVSTEKLTKLYGKKYSDSQAKLYRDALKMPSLILDKKEKMSSRFITSNGLVDDPCAVEKERAMINPWTSEEIEIFLAKLAIFGKDFRNIASFLNHKTTADCVEFYYKNHKSDYFKKTKKLDVRKQGKSSTNTYLMTSGKKWNHDMNLASLDMLGTVSVIASHADRSMVNQHTGMFHLGDYSDSKITQGHDGILERTSSFDMCNDRETAAADVLAGICGSLSSEAMGSCITSSVDPGEGHPVCKNQKVDSTIRRSLTPDVTQDVDDETCSDGSGGEMDPADWTDEEKSIFIHAMSSYGKDFMKISKCVRTRSRDQCKVFFSKARKCLGLDLIRPSHGNEGTSVSDGMNVGDDEDACLVESGSVVCSDKSGSKMDEDLPSPVSIAKHDESNPAETLNKIRQTCSDAVLTSIGEECEMKDRPGSVSDDDKHTIDIPHLVLDSRSSGSVINAEGREDVTQQGMPATLLVMEPSACYPVLDETAGVPGVCIGGSNNELEGQGHLSSGCSLDGSQEGNCNAGTSDGESGLQCSARDSNTVPNASCIAAEASSCSGLGLNSEYRHRSSSLPIISIEKPSVISLQQGRPLDIVNSYSQGSAVVKCDKICNQDRLSSTHDSQCRDKHRGKSVSRNDYQHNLSGHSVFNRVEPSPILRGYPLQMAQKDGDLSREQVQGLSKSEGNFSGMHLGQDRFLQKCDSSMAELYLPSHTSEQTSDYPKSHSRSLSAAEKPSRNGDVKLFGKILTTTPLLQQPNTNSKENDEKADHYPKSSSRQSSLKLNGQQSVNENVAPIKFDCSNYIGIENIPMSYGFWDGKKIQSGFSSLPDSAILMAKYPAAFAKCPTAYKMEQQAVVGGSSNDECSLNRVSVFPSDGNSSNVVVDYHQVYRSLDGANGAQPFTVDLKQQHTDVVLSRGNGFEGIPTSLQGRGGNVVGGVIVGGAIQRTAISDPVAAIKMHYAKTDGGSVREEGGGRR